MKPKKYNKRKAKKALLFEKCMHKMLMNLTPGLHEISTTECVTDLD